MVQDSGREISSFSHDMRPIGKKHGGFSNPPCWLEHPPIVIFKIQFDFELQTKSSLESPVE